MSERTPDVPRPWGVKQGWIVFGFSLGLLLFELCLTRVLSVFFYYHTAFLAVSLAMLGMGVGGVWVYLFPKHSKRGPQLWMLAAAVSAGTLPVLLAFLNFNHKHLSNLWSGPFVLIFVVVSIVCLLPFLAGGVTLAWWFREYKENAASLYGWDLIGAAMGALLLVPLMETLGGPSSILVCSAWLFCITGFDSIRHHRKKLAFTSMLFVFIALSSVVYHQATGGLSIQVDTDNPNKKQPKILYKKWNAFSRVVLLEDQKWYRALSHERRKYWKATMPPQRHALIDINAYAPFIRFDGTFRKVQYLKELVSNLGYHLLPPHHRSLVIGPGGGKDILGAMLFQPKQVTGIEINPILVNDLAKKKLKGFIGDLYNHPKVKIYVGDGRSILQGLHQTFDIIVANSVATWAAHSSGAMNLAEHSLYTVEACSLYLDRLTPNGILSVSLWDINKHAIPLRWINICSKAAKRRGIKSFNKHVAVVSNKWDEQSQFTTVMISKSPFTAAQSQKLQHLTQQWKYIPHYIPQASTNTKDFVNYFKDPKQWVRSFPYDISASTDNRPFFLYTVRWRDVIQFWKKSLWEEDAALVNLMITFLVVSLLLVVLIGGPLLWQTVRSTKTTGLPLPEISYFLLIGWGFMLIEIPLIQRLTLWLGHPTYALTVVLTAILLYSGLGSWWSNRWSKKEASPGTIACIALSLLVAWLLFLYVILDPLLQRTGNFAIHWRILLALVTLAPVGVLMGLPLPLGMLRLGRYASEGIPWAWGINGAGSVVASVAALGLAASIGFNNVFLMATGCYALALLVAYRAQQKLQ